MLCGTGSRCWPAFLACSHTSSRCWPKSKPMTWHARSDIQHKEKHCRAKQGVATIERAGEREKERERESERKREWAREKKRLGPHIVLHPCRKPCIQCLMDSAKHAADSLCYLHRPHDFAFTDPPYGLACSHTSSRYRPKSKPMTWHALVIFTTKTSMTKQRKALQLYI